MSISSVCTRGFKFGISFVARAGYNSAASAASPGVTWTPVTSAASSWSASTSASVTYGAVAAQSNTFTVVSSDDGYVNENYVLLDYIQSGSWTDVADASTIWT